MKTIYLSLLIACTLLVSACGMGSSDDTRTVVVSIEALRYFTEQIAGNRFKVQTMVPAGSNPEIYEPNTRQMMELTRSAMYIKVGQIGFERAWMKKLEKTAPHTIIIDSSNGIEMVRTLHGHADPHTWMSTDNAAIIAQNIYKALAAVDTRDSLYFKANLENLLTRIHALDTHIREQITRDKATTFLIYHPSLTYFAREYGLTQIPIEEEGREPSVAQLQATIKLARTRGVRCLFVQREFDNRNTQTVARETGATVVTINPLSYHWEKEMLNTARRLR